MEREARLKITKTIETNGRISDEDLVRIAEIYRSTEQFGGSGVNAVAQAKGFNVRTAARWLARARARGFLEHTDKSVAATARGKAPKSNGQRPASVVEVSAVVWEDPPPAHPGARSHADDRTWWSRLTPLTKHPKRWARIRTYTRPGQHTTAANNLRYGLLKLPEGPWEFCARALDDGTYGVYARYLGRKR